MNEIEAKNYKNRVGERISDRMFDYESSQSFKLIKNQAAILRITLINNKQIGNPDIENAFYFSIMELCNEIETIEFAYYCLHEVSFFMKDYDGIKKKQYYNGDIQKITSVTASKFSNYFNLHCFCNEIELNENALFSSKVFNIPNHEVITNFIWRQGEHIKYTKANSKRFNSLANHIQNGVSFYKITLEKEVDTLPNDVIDILIKNKKKCPTSVIRNKWICDLKTPVFVEDKEYIERYI